ncbi:hypothetical protein [Parachryseolinea silvisoli]|uniref:hypothetical protein n=1 Tax=Parachryseolinea silvisoli TaxID=2873601 RepID=UPI0022659A72|nr:hypothetical protein [Parachryseolinea silvisoli]MCD9014134.1 hypothetical protein [Parachryseolinea silvisoli]
MEPLQHAVPDDVRRILRHAVQTLRASVAPKQLSPEHLSDAVATLVQEFYQEAPPRPMPPAKLGKAHTRPAISLRVTRAALGALLHVAAALDIMAFKSGADLCRRIAPGVSTLGLDSLEPESLLRAFRYPTAAAFRKVLTLCTQIIDYIKVNRLTE